MSKCPKGFVRALVEGDSNPDLYCRIEDTDKLMGDTVCEENQNMTDLMVDIAMYVECEDWEDDVLPMLLSISELAFTDGYKTATSVINKINR